MRRVRDMRVSPILALWDFREEFSSGFIAEVSVSLNILSQVVSGGVGRENIRKASDVSGSGMEANVD